MTQILIPLGCSRYTDAALEYGCYIAKKHRNAEIAGLAIVDVPGSEDGTGPKPYPGLFPTVKMFKNRQRDAERHIQGLLRSFKEKCEHESVAFKLAEHQGIPSAGILHESMFYDLVILGLRTYFDFEQGVYPGSTLDKILDHSVTPILGVPDTCDWQTDLIRTLVLFNGSLLSARALQRFAQFAKGSAHEVILFMADEDPETCEHYLDCAEHYLHSHFIDNVRKEHSRQDVIKAVEERYLDWADLVVAGSHSKRGVIEFAVGSVVKHLIKIEKTPILLGQ